MSARTAARWRAQSGGVGERQRVLHLWAIVEATTTHKRGSRHKVKNHATKRPRGGKAEPPKSARAADRSAELDA